jgi:hypothetical protein
MFLSATEYSHFLGAPNTSDDYQGDLNSYFTAESAQLARARPVDVLYEFGQLVKYKSFVAQLARTVRFAIKVGGNCHEGIYTDTFVYQMVTRITPSATKENGSGNPKLKDEVRGELSIVFSQDLSLAQESPDCLLQCSQGRATL